MVSGKNWQVSCKKIVINHLEGIFKSSSIKKRSSFKDNLCLSILSYVLINILAGNFPAVRWTRVFRPVLMYYYTSKYINAFQ